MIIIRPIRQNEYRSLNFAYFYFYKLLKLILFVNQKNISAIIII